MSTSDQRTRDDARRLHSAGSAPDAGFTLLELLVVVVVIGVLVAIAFPAYGAYRRGAENRSAQSDLRAAAAAIEACIGDNGGRSPLAGSGGVPQPDGGVWYYSGLGKTVYATCYPDGSGTVSTTAPPAGTQNYQTINVSPGVALSYYAYAGKSYTLAARYDASPSDHIIYTFIGETGKFGTK